MMKSNHIPYNRIDANAQDNKLKKCAAELVGTYFLCSTIALAAGQEGGGNFGCSPQCSP